jgi:hypothetical protein
MVRRSLLRSLVSLFALTWSLAASPAVRANTPLGAAAVVRQFMEALRANDYAAVSNTIADDYDYDGGQKTNSTTATGPGVLFDRLLYQVIQLVQVESGVATAVVDTRYTGHYKWDLLEKNGFGQPGVVGTSRLWIEARRQPGGQWRISGLRPIRVRFVHADTPQPSLQGVQVNALSSLRAAPGAALKIEGETTYGQYQLIAIGAASKSLNLKLKDNERWSANLPAPDKPGRYFVDTAAMILATGPNHSLFFAWDEVTVPVVVR